MKGKRKYSSNCKFEHFSNCKSIYETQLQHHKICCQINSECHQENLIILLPAQLLQKQKKS